MLAPLKVVEMAVLRRLSCLRWLALVPLEGTEATALMWRWLWHRRLLELIMALALLKDTVAPRRHWRKLMCRRRWKKLRRQHHWKRPRRRHCWSSAKALLEKVEVTALLVEAKALVPLWRRSH